MNSARDPAGEEGPAARAGGDGPAARRPLRLLVFSQHYWPESFRINDVVDSLRAAGCVVEVLTGQPNYPDGRIYPGYQAQGWGTTAHPGGYPIHRVPLVPRGPGGALRLVANYLSFVLTSATLGAWLVRRRRFDVVFVYGTSPILQAIGAIVIARLHGAKLVTWVQDLWPQSLEVTGYVRDPRALAAVALVVRWIYRRCDLLLAQSDGFVPAVRAMSGATPVAVHPNPAEAAFETPPAGSPALVLPPGFNVVFAGNLGTAQALDTVLAAAERLRDVPDLRIVLVGSGARGEWLAAEAARRALPNVMLPGRFPPDAMPGILAQASALLVSLARSPIMSLTVPSKVQAYLAAGRPIVASLDGEGARVVEASGAGLAVPAEDAAALAAAIRQLRQSPADRRASMGAAGVAYYREHFRPDNLAKRLVTRLEALRAMRSPPDRRR